MEPRAEGCTVLELSARPVSRIKRFVGLGLAEQVLLLRALFLVSAIRLGLFLFPFRILQRFAQRRSRKFQHKVFAGTIRLGGSRRQPVCAGCDLPDAGPGGSDVAGAIRPRVTH